MQNCALPVKLHNLLSGKVRKCFYSNKCLMNCLTKPVFHQIEEKRSSLYLDQ